MNKLAKEAIENQLRYQTRRHFLKDSMLGLGSIAMGSLLSNCGSQSQGSANTFDPANPLLARMPSFAPKAKSVIYLHMAGAPSQLELFDYKPELSKLDGQL
ncbi:MAG: DUF1501 domain-containing protein, partial [Bacteroidota bacterium]